MANKEIKRMFQNGGKDKIINKKGIIGIDDLRHDIENQIVKINQKLESIRNKNYSSSEKRPLLQRYKDICTEYPDEVALGMIFIDRVINQISCEMVCMTIVDGTTNLDAYKEKQELNIHKIIQRLLFLYSADLLSNNITYDLMQSEKKWRICEPIFSAILLKIIQNCTKYCQPNTILQIKISDKEIIFSMRSLQILFFEKDRIFEDGYSGKIAIQSSKGKTGKGLFHARKLAEFHSLGLSVKIGSNDIKYNGFIYSDNEFIIKIS